MIDRKYRSILFLIAAVIASTPFGWAQSVHTIRGRVADSKTGEGLPSANVRVAGSTRGTIANLDGSYLISLPDGDYVLIFSYVGYRTDSVGISLTGNINKNTSLEPADIILPEVVSVAEDPAYAIIRKAIANKHYWSKLLHSYEFKGFTRLVFYRDTSVAAITESYTTGYWRDGDSLHEVVTQKRETKNLPEMNLVASVGDITNFTDDVVDVIGYKFVGPVAVDALDYYKYKLLRTFRKDGVGVFEIKVIPDSRLIPLFSGTISVADSSFAVIGIDLKPNDVLNIPLIRDLKMQFGQRYSIYEDKFWMPTDIVVNFGGTISFLGLKIPRISFDQTSVIYDYRLNSQIPDTVFDKPLVVVDSSATKYDSTFWGTHEVLALSGSEQKAYLTLDSTQTLEKLFKATGATATLLGKDSPLSFLKYVDLRFDRVEGLFLGGTYTYFSGGKRTGLTVSSEGTAVQNENRGWRADVAAGYGISDKTFKWRLGGDYPFGEKTTIDIGADVYHDIKHFPDDEFFSPLATTLTSLIGTDDYYNYYMARGWQGNVVISPVKRLVAGLTFTSEDESSVIDHTSFSILSFGHKYRPNPPIEEGTLRSFGFDIRYGDAKIPLGIIPVDAVELSGEYSSPSILKSDFWFGRYRLTASYRFVTFLSSYLLPPELQLMFSGGMSTGNLPPQRDFVLDSQLGGIAPFGVLKTAHPTEYVGDRYVMLSAEQNLRNVPFLALGVPFLYESGLEMLVDGSIAKSWLNGIPTTNGWYYEAGLGIGRILGLIRADFTWRLSKPNDLYFSIGISSIL